MDSSLYLFGPKFIRHAKLQALVLHELPPPADIELDFVKKFPKIEIPVFDVSTSKCVKFLIDRTARLDLLAKWTSYEWQMDYEYCFRDRFCASSTKMSDLESHTAHMTPIQAFPRGPILPGRRSFRVPGVF